MRGSCYRWANCTHLQLLPADLTVAHISASSQISIFGDNEEESEDAFTALPVPRHIDEAMFEEYLVLSHANEYVQTEFKSIIRVVASTDNMQLEITPGKKALTVEGGISLQKNAEALFVQHRLDSLTLTSSSDLTGTVIMADKPIAVYSGHEGVNIPIVVSSCSHAVEQPL